MHKNRRFSASLFLMLKCHSLFSKHTVYGDLSFVASLIRNLSFLSKDRQMEGKDFSLFSLTKGSKRLEKRILQTRKRIHVQGVGDLHKVPRFY